MLQSIYPLASALPRQYRRHEASGFLLGANMKEIQLTQGQVTIVDDWWFDELNQYKWHAAWSPCTQSYYAVRSSPTLFGKRIPIRMHAVIAGTPKGMHTDHINHNTLYNLESNLRVCTASQNRINRGKQIDNTSGYKGVCWHKTGWTSQIKINGKTTYLGIYLDPEEAARAYDKAAKELHGEFAVLNFG